MRWTCPKCGKKLDISNEQLIDNDGVILCPQCLLQARQPVPSKRVAARYDQVDAETSTPPAREPLQQTTTPTPPPHKTGMKQAKTSYRYTGVGGNTSSTKKKTGSNKKSKKKKQAKDGISALGCLGRTIVFTLLLFALYVFFGLLLEALQ